MTNANHNHKLSPNTYTCDQMGVCKDTACAACPYTKGLPAGQRNQAAPVRRETDADNLLQWQNALLAQALAEQADHEERERMAQVLAPTRRALPTPRPALPTTRRSGASVWLLACLAAACAAAVLVHISQLY